MERKDSTIEKVSVDLDIDEHIDMQKRGWQIQTVGLCFIFIFILSAAVGLYGDGIVSKTIVNQNGVKVEFQRFFRFEAKMDVRISASAREDIMVSFPNDYLSHFEITSIEPMPASSRIIDGRIEYMFNGGEGAQISFHLVPEDFGTVKGSVIVNDNVFGINHFIFP